MPSGLRWAVIGFTVGFVGGLLFFVFVIRGQGCKTEFHANLSFVSVDCSRLPHEIALDFGGSPSPMSLRQALEAVEQLTKGRGLARIYVDDAVRQGPFAQTMVDPPAGPVSSLDFVRQLLISARAEDKIEVCLAPGGAGYRVQLKRP